MTKQCELCGFSIPPLDDDSFGECRSCALRADVDAAADALYEAERVRDDARHALNRASEALTIARTALDSAGDALWHYWQSMNVR